MKYHTRDTGNPWIDLNIALSNENDSVVLEQDKVIIDEWNKKQLDDRYKIKLNRIPEPFIGNPSGDVWILNLNPKYNYKDEKHHYDQAFQASAGRNLCLKTEKIYLSDHPTSPGYDWWSRKLKLAELINLHRKNEQGVWSSIFCIEYFPYHSENFHPGFPRLESQKFTFELLKEAIKVSKLRKKIFIIMKGERCWLESVPDLGECPYFILSSPQSGCISRNNLILRNRDLYKEFIDLLK